MTPKYIKYYIIFLSITIFCFAKIANANILINEVQLSPTEERFIELYNSGSSSIDLTDWYIQRKTATGTTFGSLVSKTYFNGKSIDSGGYFIISRSDLLDSDIIYENLTLTESNTIQIKNSKQELIDKVGWGDVSDCGNICAPNPTEGKSIQKTSNGNWSISTSTRGYSNGSSSNNTDNNDSNNDLDEENNFSSTTVISTPTKKEELEILKITTKIISPKIAVAGIPFTLNSITTTNRGKTYMVGKFIWNFGDGNKLEVNRVEPFDYIYDYPGEYALSLSFFDDSFTEIPDAVNKMIIKVIPSDIYISSIGDYTDPYIELENKSSYDMDISNWIINGVNHNFTIPKWTIILKDHKLKLSPRITGFTGEDMKYINIMNPDKEIITTYPIQKKISVQNDSSNNKITAVSSSKSDNSKDNSAVNDLQVINLNDLNSSAGEAKVDISNGAYPFIGLLVIIGLGIFSFLFIKKKKEVKDYIEKDIRPEDMTIIE